MFLAAACFALRRQVIAEMELQLQQAQASQAGHTAAAAAAAAAVPADLRCPITFCLLVDPVILVESAQTYERAAIQEWLSRGNLKDPVTGGRCRSTWGLGLNTQPFSLTLFPKPQPFPQDA